MNIGRVDEEDGKMNIMGRRGDRCEGEEKD
jgi:hypothetical protein